MNEKLEALFKKFYEENHEALFNDPFFADNMRKTFYAGYFSGCHAQAVADRVAVNSVPHTFMRVIDLDECLDRLSKAEIKS